jgi:hypothetical protein
MVGETGAEKAAKKAQQMAARKADYSAVATAALTDGSKVVRKAAHSVASMAREKAGQKAA